MLQRTPITIEYSVRPGQPKLVTSKASEYKEEPTPQEAPVENMKPSFCPFCATPIESVKFIGNSVPPLPKPPAGGYQHCSQCKRSWQLQDTASSLRTRLSSLSDDDLWLILQMLNPVFKNLVTDVAETQTGGAERSGAKRQREANSNWSISHISRVLAGTRKSKPTEYAITKAFRKRIEEAGLLQYL